MMTQWMSRAAVFAMAIFVTAPDLAQAQRVRVGVGNRGGYYNGYGRGYYNNYGYGNRGGYYSPYRSGYGYYGNNYYRGGVDVTVGSYPQYGTSNNFDNSNVDTAIATQSMYGNPNINIPQNAARLSVIVPAADCLVWLDSTEMQSRGRVREFYSPPLEMGKSYTYKVRVTGKSPDGTTMDQTRVVPVTPGQTSTVDFNRPETPATTLTTPASPALNQ